MGLYSQMAIQSSKEIDSSELIKIRNNIIERFGESLFGNTGDDLVHPMDKTGYKESNLEKYVYEIDIDSRIYSEFYQRGDGLRLSSLILYLTREGYDVLYGHEYMYNKYTELDAVRLYNYFLKYGYDSGPTETFEGEGNDALKNRSHYIYTRLDGNMFMPCFTQPKYRIEPKDEA